MANALAVAACGFEGAPGEPDSPGGGVEVGPGAGDEGGGGGGGGSNGPPPSLDRDADGVLDAVDNCPTVANAKQYDEDADLLGDVCDNCPHLANALQEDALEGAAKDGVGDACDPNPTMAGDRLALFLGFNEAADVTGWSYAGPNDFKVAGGKLQNRVKTDLALAWRNGLDLGDATLVTKVNYLELSTNYRYRGVAVLGRFVRGGAGGALGTGVGCGEMSDTATNGGQAFYNGALYSGPAFNNQVFGNAALTANHTIVYTARVNNTGASCGAAGQSWSRSSGANGTGVALSVWGAAVDIDYLVAYKR